MWCVGGDVTHLKYKPSVLLYGTFIPVYLYTSALLRERECVCVCHCVWVLGVGM